MKPREIVQRTIDFDYPERVARSFEPSDFIGASPVLPNPYNEWRKTGSSAWERKDEWGNIWRRIDPTSKGEVSQGAVVDLQDAVTIPLPNFDNPEYYHDARKIYASQPDLYPIAWIHGYTFSIARKLRRMDNYLMDLATDMEKVRVLHDRVDEQIKNQIKHFARVGSAAVMLAEDWGTQLDLLISPRMWRQEFKPRFQSLNDYAHDHGLSVFMHSCGKMTAIIPDLVETGVDVLQFDQPRVHGIDLLAHFQESSSNPITYWCPVDIQQTLQTRNETTIRIEADEMLSKLWRKRGGFIAGYYSDNASIGLTPKYQQYAIDEFLRKGVANR